MVVVGEYKRNIVSGVESDRSKVKMMRGSDRATRPAHQGCRRHVTRPPHWRSRRYRVTAGQPTCAISPCDPARYAVCLGAWVRGGRIPPMWQVGARLL
jgi:hypothetical protein